MHTDTEKEIKAPCPSMGEVVNKAAKHLPEGYCIEIMVENGGYGVTLIARNFEKSDFQGEGIVGEINEAINWANGFKS